LSKSEAKGRNKELKFRELSAGVAGFREEFIGGIESQYSKKHVKSEKEIQDLEEKIKQLEKELER
jgi:hypothetical protein